MSPTSNRIEFLAELHNISPLVLLEWLNERLAIMQSDNVPDAERLALECIERELSGGCDAR